MKVLIERIANEGKVLNNAILKVDGFMNHQIDPLLMKQIGEEFASYFANTNSSKILTAETSGIAPALAAGMAMNLPIVFARKHQPATMGGEPLLQSAASRTHGVEVELIVSNEYLGTHDRVLIIDDFLSRGKTLKALVDLVRASGATLTGIGTVIEKSFERGRDALGELNVPIHSLAIIEKFENGQVVFKDVKIEACNGC